MINYRVRTPDPVGSFMRGRDRSRRNDEYDQRNLDRENNRKIQQEDRNYLTQVVRPREDRAFTSGEERKRQRWEQSQQDRSAKKMKQSSMSELDSKAMATADALAQYSPEQQIALLGKVTDPKLREKTYEYVNKRHAEERKLIEENAKQLQYATSAIMSTNDVQTWNSMAPKLVEQFPGLKDVKLTANSPEELNNVKNGLMGYIKQQSGNLKTAWSQLDKASGKGKWSVDKDKAKMASSRREEYRKAAESYDSGASDGFMGFGKKEGKHFPQFDQWYQSNYPEEYAIAKGGSGQQRPQQGTIDPTTKRGFIQQYMNNPSQNNQKINQRQGRSPQQGGVPQQSSVPQRPNMQQQSTQMGGQVAPSQPQVQRPQVQQSGQQGNDQGRKVASGILNGSIGPKEIINAGEQGMKALSGAVSAVAQANQWTQQKLFDVNRLLGQGTIDAINKVVEIMRADTNQQNAYRGQ